MILGGKILCCCYSISFSMLLVYRFTLNGAVATLLLSFTKQNATVRQLYILMVNAGKQNDIPYKQNRIYCCTYCTYGTSRSTVPSVRLRIACLADYGSLFLRTSIRFYGSRSLESASVRRSSTGTPPQRKDRWDVVPVPTSKKS